MASISYYHRYVKHMYQFEWNQRGKWLRLLGRFHTIFSSNWEVRAKSKATNKVETISFSVNPDASMRDLEKHLTTQNLTISPTAMVKVIVAGTAFFGAMPDPARIDWKALPEDPKDTPVPEHVAKFAKTVAGMGSIVGNHTDIGISYDLSAFKDIPIGVEWFPYIIREMRKKEKSYLVRSLFYSPSEKTMFVLVRSTEDDDDLMVVRFDEHRADFAADVPFDLDDGFHTNETEEMRAAYDNWVDNHERAPEEPLLPLLAPYDKMWL